MRIDSPLLFSRECQLPDLEFALVWTNVEELKRVFVVADDCQYVAVFHFSAREGVIVFCTYRGPWKAVVDDDGHTLYRGERMAVCDKTYRIYTRAPYVQDIDPIQPMTEVPLDEAVEYDCRRNARRHPRETKGEDYSATIEADGDCCGENGSCC